MDLSFTEKSKLNRTILKDFRLRLVDKPTLILDDYGVIYDHSDPSNESLLGSIGQHPDPTFDAYQPPNAMGMVLLVTPYGDSKENQEVSLILSGQFDISHRYIPDIDVMKKNLKIENENVKESQTIVTSYKRLTVQFNDLPINISVQKDLNNWITLPPGNPLENAFANIETSLSNDPRAFKRCKPGRTGAAVFHFIWSDDEIQTQDDLNDQIAIDIFEDDKEILPYQVKVRARLREAPVSLTDVPNAYLLEVYLENNTTQEVARRYGINNPHLLDAQLKTIITRGVHHPLPHKLSPEDYRYNDKNDMAGYGITTSVRKVEPNTFVTDSMPTCELERIENPSSEDLGMQYGPKFEALAKDPTKPLESLLNAIDGYASQWDERIRELLKASKVEEAKVSEGELASFRVERELVNDGITLLEKNDDLRRCFQWMNEVMLLAIKRQGKKFDEWRLFQLGFILTQIRAIYERCCPETELTSHIDTAEVLWFSTGGGKTEAYLGIFIMSMLYERIYLRTYGVTGWMRFPLRMLSVQQFQRLSYVVAQANIIRQNEGLGGHPFTIGYFTGRGTPSRITSSAHFYTENYLPVITQERLDRYKFISDCPYCDEADTVKITKDLSKGRIMHVCTNAECWSNTHAEEGSYGEGISGELGIYVSDEEVYRYLPTIMVGTIDKLAVIGHNYRFRYFFGGATHFCPSHGFSFEGKCDHSILKKNDDGSWDSERCKNNSRTSKVKTHSLSTMKFPGFSFLLQDELHLLSENLGNFNAHYETLLTAIQKANGGRTPKVLTATATIKDFEGHVHHLYQRHARRFPAPGFLLRESFYARVVMGPDGHPMIRRLFAGILPLGAGATLFRATAIASSRYLTLIDDICHEIDRDPQSAAGRLCFAESKLPAVKDHIKTFLNAILLYVNSRVGMSDTSRFLEDAHRGKYPERKWRQLDGQSTLDEIQQVITHIETKDPEDDTRQIAATSVVSHGVDMHRLNMMVIAGWPKSIAEYMQTSARAGRIEPGIVLTIMNSKNLFQSNVFMDFQDYHLFMDKLVESVPVNRFAPNLLDRTLPGIFAAWIYNWAPSMPWGEGITTNAGKVKTAFKDSTFKAREELRQRLMLSLEIPAYKLSSFDDRVSSDFMHMLDRKVEEALTQLEGMKNDIADERLSEALERLLGNRPMTSMRDIESQILVLPQTDDAVMAALER